MSSRSGAQFHPLSTSQVQLCGFGASSCGYCHGSSSSSISYGLVSTHMLIEDYASLLLLGWRRSGTYFYKPTNHLTCCPAYTIRLRVSEFKPSKDQRRISRRFDRFLETGMVTTCKEDAPSDVVATDAMHKSTGAHSLTVDTVPSEFTEERFELYKRYQTSVHKDAPDTLTAKGFTRFLVQSPLVASSSSSRTQGSSSSSGGGRGIGVGIRKSEQPLGTFHQLYRLDGKLIAVGVIDLLPVGFSSVYFFYDPDHRNLVLGKYSALREISYCRYNGIENYFMGYYIHSCEKMRYKAEFSPSELLCPTTHNWFPIKQCLSALNANTFTPFDPELAAARALILTPPTPPTKPDPELTTAGMDCCGGLHHAGRDKEDQVASRKSSKEKKKRADQVPGEGERPSTRDSEVVGVDHGGDEGDGDHEDENEDEDEGDGEEGEGDSTEMSPNIMQLHNLSPLSRFTPVFPRGAAEGAALYASISLDLGFGVPVFVGQLKVKGQEIIRKMFDDLCMNCGPQMCSRLIVKLG